MTFDEAALERLLASSTFPKVSLLMPTHGAGAGAGQDPIRYEQLVRSAQEELAGLGTDRELTGRLCGDLRRLVSPGGFWRAQQAGMAVFASPAGTESYRLPEPVDELVVVGADFELAPLVGLARAGRFAVLAVSRAGVRLFEGTPYELSERELEDAPEGLDEITQYYELERQLQFRQASTAGRGTQVAMFHGHGIGEGRGKELVLQYLRAVDQSVRRALPNGNEPLVVAGPSEVPALYGQVSTYGKVVDRHIEINPDRLKESALRERALDVLQQWLREPEQAALDRYFQLTGTGRTSERIEELVPAAAQGRVDTLLLASSIPLWGTFDPESFKVEQHDPRRTGDRDLVNLATVHTLRNGGSVVPVESEDVLRVAAILRF